MSTIDDGRTIEYRGVRFRTVGKGIRHCQEPSCRRITNNYLSHAAWHATGVGDVGFPAGLTVVDDIASERARQDEKWGEQNHPDGTGPTLQLGMVGWAKSYREWADDLRTATDTAAERGEVTWAHILLEEVFEALAEDDPERLRTELVQVAAVSQQWVEGLDRRQS